MPDTEFLPQTIDQLADAQSRQTRYWVEMLGAEEELNEARAAWITLGRTLSVRWREAHDGWTQAKRDVAEATRLLDGLMT